MDVLRSIKASHVTDALHSIRRDGVAKGRGSTKFCLLRDGVHFPPKYVVAEAARRSLGRALRPDELSGGPQTNELLKGLGFDVVACPCGGLVPPSLPKDLASASPERRPVVPRSLPRASSSLRKPRDREGTVIARIVTRGQTPAGTKAPERILLDAFEKKWPLDTRAKFAITPDGFVRHGFPRNWSGRSGWESRARDVESLFVLATRHLESVVTSRVYAAAAGKAEVLTVGLDLLDGPNLLHAELVAVFDVGLRRLVRWTGKSYPTSDQEHTLVHVRSLESHLLEIAGERVLVLGCHDLNMFSPRGHANQSPDGLRRARCDEMKEILLDFEPTVVLQHPHSTDTPNIWRLPWLSLEKRAPSITCWASGLGYYKWEGTPRAPLGRVKELTKGGSRATMDIEIDSTKY